MVAGFGGRDRNLPFLGIKAHNAIVHVMVRRATVVHSARFSTGAYHSLW